MGRVTAFSFVSLDGYSKGPGEDIGWHRHGEEESEYSAESLSSGNTLFFRRVTYELMADSWPTPMAIEQFPVVAEGMNKAEKIVFSRTLKKVEWSNTRQVKDNIEEEVKRMKRSFCATSLLKKRRLGVNLPREEMPQVTPAGPRS